MPTAITHALVGGALAHAAPAGPSRWRVVAALMAVSVIPDLDVVAFKLGIPYAHMFGHRGFSHSLVFALLLSLMTCLVLFRGVARFSSIKWWGFFSITFAAVSSHGLLDAATDAGLGVGLFIPFSQERIFYEYRPIRTASVNPLAFFSSRSLAILWSEAVWVWLPLFLTSIIVIIVNFLLRLTKAKGA